MKAEDLTTLGAAMVHFRGQVLALAPAIEGAATSDASAREIDAEGFIWPAWADANSHRANWRLLDMGKAVAGKLLDGWQPPRLEDVAPVYEFEQVEQLREAFLKAAAAVAVEVAAHARQSGRRLDDGTGWRRCEPGHFPDQALDKLFAAREALAAYAAAWIGAAGTLRGATFLPGVTR